MARTCTILCLLSITGMLQACVALKFNYCLVTIPPTMTEYEVIVPSLMILVMFLSLPDSSVDAV